MAEALRYKDKVTIVTGGSKGIGRGCVEVFGKFFFFCLLNAHVFDPLLILWTSLKFCRLVKSKDQPEVKGILCLNVAAITSQPLI